MKRDLRKERLWRDQISQWGKSGQAVRRFCRVRGLSEASFYWWRRRLAQGTVADASVESSAPGNVIAEAPLGVTPHDLGFIEAPWRHDRGATASFSSQPGTRNSGVEIISPFGWRLRVERNFDESALRRVLNAMRDEMPEDATGIPPRIASGSDGLPSIPPQGGCERC